MGSLVKGSREEEAGEVGRGGNEKSEVVVRDEEHI